MDKLDWLKIIVPAAAPVVAWLIYKRNSKQKLKEKQQEAIADLIKVLSANSIEFGFEEVSENGSSGHVYNWTLLDIGKQKSDLFVPEFDDEELYFHYKSNRLIGIKEFIDNPYIPSRIRKALQNFHPRSYDNGDKGIVKSPAPLVSLSTDYFVENAPFELERNQKPNQLKFPMGAIAFESWLSFKTSCTTLVREINRNLDRINASELKVS